MKYKPKFPEIHAKELHVVEDGAATGEILFSILGVPGFLNENLFSLLFEPVVEPAALAKRAYKAKAVKAPKVKREAPARVEAPKADKPAGPTIDDAVCAAVAEAPRTTAEVVDRVEVLRPGTNRASAAQATQKLKVKGEIARNSDDFKWYPTRNMRAVA